jgi:ActR/RegA family two-component response regulator
MGVPPSAAILLVDPEPWTLAPLPERPDVVISPPSIAQALIAIKQYRPALVIAEYRLSDGSGLELIAHIKSKTPGTLAVMATAAGSERVCAAAFRFGAAEYFIKPIAPIKLHDSIRRLLHKAVVGRQPTNPTESQPCGHRNRVKQAAEMLDSHYSQQNPQRLNGFAYVSNAPTGFRDPLGLAEIREQFQGWAFCPPAPPGYRFDHVAIEFVPLQACIIDAFTRELICGSVYNQLPCVATCYYSCVPSGRKDDACRPFTLPGLCYSAQKLGPY